MTSFSGRYSYTKANVQAYAPLSGGVYRLIYKKNGDYYVFYVGQSDNLQRRLLEHLSDSDKDVCIRRHLRDYDCFFRFIEISSLDERVRKEQEEIKNYNPTCNG